ncbi:response regulator transcription factor [Streptomyces sp. HC44]|uniref:Response regulator transcription factor n=2 Tax=Streptomyces scabichelini TaxID=2711217 RepID=A0A6G4UZ05_9ACTN|nr:response regulator transcription factor [Streptomyces scabichelini]
MIEALADVLSRRGLPGTGLSRREQEVSRLVGLGYTNRQIGRALDISPHTVETYMRRMFDKLGVRSRAAIAARYFGLPEEEGETMRTAM